MSNASAIVLLLAFFFGWLGYRSSLAFRAVRGVTPWRLPSLVWALICFLFMVVGLVVELVAQLTTRPNELGAPPPVPWRPWRAGLSTGPGGGSGSARGNQPPPALAPPPASLPSAEAAPPERLSRWPRPPAAPDGLAATFGWYGDPAGRHQARYFDGRDWTQLVRDGADRSEDPLEP